MIKSNKHTPAPTIYKTNLFSISLKTEESRTPVIRYFETSINQLAKVLIQLFFVAITLFFYKCNEKYTKYTVEVLDIENL